ncbi:Proliferation-associated protein 2G4 [Allomyces javanicus]|nr:Proliferation-associated protein 2G4 [Allomyces javanicus]
MPASHAPSSPTLLAEQLSAMTLQNNLSDPTVMGKYRLAADICNAVMRELLELVVPGASTADLCQHGDDLIVQKCAAAGFKSVRKGVALPTSVNVNNTVQHYAPVADDDENHPGYVLQENDLVKVELGVHIDGYACTAGHTTILNPNTDFPTTGAVADVVTAAHFAAEMAWRMIKPGRAASEIHEAMTRIASAYKCVPVRGTYSTRIQRYTLDAGNHLYNAIDPEATDADGHKIKQEDFQFSVNEAYDVQIYLASTTHTSTGDAVITDTDSAPTRAVGHPTLYHRDPNARHTLRVAAARKLISHITQAAETYPVTTASLDTSLRFGLKECTTHGLLVPRNVTRTADGTAVAAFRFTVLLLPSGQVLRLTLPHQQLPYVCSDHEMPVELATLLFLDQPNALRVPPVPAAQPGGATPPAEGSSGGSRRRSRSRKRSKSRGSSVDAREPL